MRPFSRARERWRGAIATGVGLVLILGLVPPVAGQDDTDGADPAYGGTNWWLRLRSTGYAFQSAERTGGELDHFEGYQHIDGSVSGMADNRLSFRVGARFADDLKLDRRVTDRERLYVGYAQYKLDVLSGRVRGGRMFVQEGPSNVTMDGLWLQLHPMTHWELRAWAGAQAPLSRVFEPGSFSDEAAWGGRLLKRLHPRLRVAASYGYRERHNLTSSSLVGFEAKALPVAGLRTVANFSYETEQKLWHRAELLAQFQHRHDHPVLSLQLLDRRPAIEAESYFARFSTVERIRLVRSSLRYERENGYGAEVDYFGGFIDDRMSTRAGLAALTPFARVGYSIRFGDGGEENRFFGDVQAKILSWLRAEAGAVVSTYALLEDPTSNDERDLTTAFGRLRARLRRGLLLTAEIQSLDDPYYSEDLRFLVGLDLDMGRGASNFGLGTGGWFE